MERKLINYLPYIARNYMELECITGAEQPEFEAAWMAADDLLNNQFIDTAGDLGVSRWENILKIVPKGTDSLEVRKTRIKAMLNLELPYTFPWLKKWLTSICGPAGHEEFVSDYTINIQLDHTLLPDADSMSEEILDMLLAVRPANMRVLMAALLQSHGSIAHGACAEVKNTVEIWPQIADENRSGIEIYPKTED